MKISTHTPLAGRDLLLWLATILKIFLLTRPSRGATTCNLNAGIPRRISTHTPLAGRDILYRSRFAF